MKKLITAVLGGTAVASLAFASASALTVNAGTLQAGVDDNLVCDQSGVDVDWGLETTDNKVYFATVKGIAEACQGSEMFLRTNLMTDAAKVVIVGDTAKFSFTPAQDATALTDVSVWINN